MGGEPLFAFEIRDRVAELVEFRDALADRQREDNAADAGAAIWKATSG